MLCCFGSAQSAAGAVDVAVVVVAAEPAVSGSSGLPVHSSDSE